MIRFHVLKWFSVLFNLKSLYLLACSSFAVSSVSFAFNEKSFPIGLYRILFWFRFHFRSLFWSYK